MFIEEKNGIKWFIMAWLCLSSWHGTVTRVKTQRWHLKSFHDWHHKLRIQDDNQDLLKLCIEKRLSVFVLCSALRFNFFGIVQSSIGIWHLQLSLVDLKCPWPFNLFSFGRFRYLSITHFRKKFSEILNPFFLRALKVKAVLSMFSPIVRISPPLSQMCPDMEHDVRKGHRAKSQGILNRLKDTIRYLCRKTLQKRTHFHTNNLWSHYVNFQCFVLWNGFLFLRHS